MRGSIGENHRGRQQERNPSPKRCYLVILEIRHGTITSETASGTYTVNPDCTGTFNLTVYSSGVELFTVTASSAFDNRMQHLRGIFTLVVAPNGTALATVIAVDCNKQ